MRLDLVVTPTRAPTPLGASAYNGKIACFGQDDTYSYFQTGMAMTGTLRWGEVERAGQRYVGTCRPAVVSEVCRRRRNRGNPRTRSHEWRTINFDNGVDLSIWRQFRPHRTAMRCNRLPASRPAIPMPAGPRSVSKTSRSPISSYVRWPESVRPPDASTRAGPIPARPAPDHLRRHCNWTLSESRWWRLRRTVCRSSTWKARIGTAGTLAGQPVTALCLQRAFDRALPGLGVGSRYWPPPWPTRTQPNHRQLQAVADQLPPLLASGRRDEAQELLAKLRPDQQDPLATILDDLITALSRN